MGNTLEMIPSRTTLTVAAPFGGLDGPDTWRALAWGSRALGTRLAQVNAWHATLPEAGRTYAVTPRRHGRGLTVIDLWYGPLEGDKWQRRGELASLAAEAVASITHTNGEPAHIGKADFAGLPYVWSCLTDIPLDQLPELGGQVTSLLYKRWKASIGLGEASLVDIEKACRIGRSTASRLDSGKLNLGAVHRWASRGGYKGDLNDFLGDFWDAK